MEKKEATEKRLRLVRMFSRQAIVLIVLVGGFSAIDLAYRQADCNARCTSEVATIKRDLEPCSESLVRLAAASRDKEATENDLRAAVQASTRVCDEILRDQGQK